MKIKYSLVLFLITSISLLTSCNQYKSVNPFVPPNNLDKAFQTGKYFPKIDNFIIILDSSSSMSTAYEGNAYSEYSKFDVAKEIIKLMNETIPRMEINGAIHTFGHGTSVPAIQSETIYGPTVYFRPDLEQSLDSIKSPAEGNSPAGLAVATINDVIGSMYGENAVIFISDGENLENDPIMKVKDLNNRHGDRTCLYTIWVGNNPEGKELMEKLAWEMDCGFSKSADQIASSDSMEDFVREVFLTTEEKRDVDSDGDGVYDSMDECPNTPVGVKVDGLGCAKIAPPDSDGDGVYDDNDECPDTPGGAIVDNRGCWVVMGVKFGYKKFNVNPEYNSNLNNVVSILKSNPDLRIRVEGHTDNIGSKKYNLKLSRKRAKAIKDYLVGRGISQSRITSTGLGFAQPIAGNDTSEGRALNRRAELIPVK